MRIALIFLVMLALPATLAYELTSQGPQTGETIDPLGEGFTFAATQDWRGADISTCSLLIDGEVAKTLTINGGLGGTTRRFTVAIEDGNHTWNARCTTKEGQAIYSPETAFIAKNAVQSNVKVTSSGIIRGSLLHSFTMRNAADQLPTEVPKLNPGDIVSVSVEIPPSKITKEFFYKSRNIQNGRNYLRLTAGLDAYELYQGERIALPINAGLNVIAQFTELEGTKATIVFYPTVSAPAEDDSSQEQTEDEQPIEDVPDEQEIPIEEPEDTPEDTPPVHTPTGPEPTPHERQGFFTWLFSLLASIFGA